MWIVRLTGIGMVAVFCSLFGFFLQNEMKQRVQLLQELYRSVFMLRQEITYLKAPLEEAAIHIGGTLEDPLASFFQEVGRKLELLPGASFFCVWKEMQKNYLTDSGFKKEDLELLEQFGRYLGSLESGGTEGLLTVYEQRMERAWNEAQKEYQEKAQLYQKLGIMGGIFLILLLL